MKYWLIRFITALCICALLAFSYYRYYQLAAHNLGKDGQYSYNETNAYKHAIAASDLYSFLSAMYVPDEINEQFILRLGIINEYLEQEMWTPEKRDSTGEVAKDLTNNYYGILIARWCGTTHCGSNRTIILSLIRKGTLITDGDTLEKRMGNVSPYDVPSAVGWFNAEQPNLQRKIQPQLR